MAVRLMYFHPLSPRPRVSAIYLCECVYMTMTEWMGREKCKWESCVLCAEGGFYFFTVRRILYVHINFPTPCSALLLMLLLLFRTFMSTLTYHPFCFLFSCARCCVGELEKLSSRYFSNVYGFLYPHWACRKYNQFYFVRAHSTPLASRCPLFRATLKYFFFDSTRSEQEKQKIENFSIFWHFPKMKFCNVVSVGWVEGSSGKLNNRTYTGRWQTIGNLFLHYYK